MRKSRVYLFPPSSILILLIRLVALALLMTRRARLSPSEGSTLSRVASSSTSRHLLPQANKMSSAPTRRICFFLTFRYSALDHYCRAENREKKGGAWEKKHPVREKHGGTLRQKKKNIHERKTAVSVSQRSALHTVLVKSNKIRQKTRHARAVLSTQITISPFSTFCPRKYALPHQTTSC